MKQRSIITLCLVSIVLCSCAVADSISVIPKPQFMIVKQGTIDLRNAEQIVITGCEQSRGAAIMLQDTMRPALNKTLPIVTELTVKRTKAVFLNIVKQGRFGDEGYLVNTSNNCLEITAHTGAGLFYGVQTVRQLLPAGIEDPSIAKNSKLELPIIKITDQPRYGWRGLMLDESRAFFGKETVKKLLDRMALYKMNRFHWHLTDSPGWRIEIKKYPKLTTVGAVGNHIDPDAEAKFYTQQDIKEIVEYAAKRHIVIIPEIDMPGHATAANRAYPEFSGGGSKKHPEFTFNPGYEGTYVYLENILKEVTELFPGKWLHYGGDEVSFGNKQWIDIKHVKQLMKDEELTDIGQVEHYFNRRMADVIKKLGKVTVGWDEIVQAGVPNDNALIMWWRHDKPQQLNTAIENGFDVVLCPRIPCYFDFVQHDSHKYGRRWKGFCDIDSVYQYPKFPKDYTKQQHEQIKGIQANLWTERIQNKKRLDFMTFPRLAAISEAAWTIEKNKDLADFRKRLKTLLARHDVLGDYYFNFFDPKQTPEPAGPQ